MKKFLLSLTWMGFFIFLKIFNKKEDKFNILSKVIFNNFKSNHPRRLKLFQEIFLGLNFFRKNIYEKLPDTQRNFVVPRFTKKNIIFIGDSHVEFYSRVINFENEVFSKNTWSLWLGPKTIIGFQDPFNLIKFRETSHFIKNFQNKKDNIFIFTLGSIDVRCLFYEIIVRKIVKNKKDLLKLFRLSLKNVFKEIIKCGYKKKNVMFLGIPNNYDSGLQPKKISGLIKHKNKLGYPTFGSLKERNKWTVNVNKIISKECQINKFKYIDIIKVIKKNKINDQKNRFDNIHYISKKFIECLYYEINRRL
jgi:hypothetical protein